jgi:hypothetical protein
MGAPTYTLTVCNPDHFRLLLALSDALDRRAECCIVTCHYDDPHAPAPWATDEDMLFIVERGMSTPGNDLIDHLQAQMPLVGTHAECF